jgi:hypothetical protein
MGIGGRYSRESQGKNAPDGEYYTFADAVMCREVQAMDPGDPIGVKDVFSASDWAAFTWVKLTDVYEALQIRFRWYRPDGSLQYTCAGTTEDPADYGNDYWSWYKIWCGMYIDDHIPEDFEGVWTATVEINETGSWVLERTLEFTIRYHFEDQEYDPGLPDLTSRTMATGVIGDRPANPGTYSFPDFYPPAYSWLCLNDVADPITVKWTWHRPSGELYREHTESFPDPGHDSWHAAIKTWDWIDIEGAPPADDPGDWQVKVYVQDVYGTWDLETTSSFTIIAVDEPRSIFLPLILRNAP